MGWKYVHAEESSEEHCVISSDSLLKDDEREDLTIPISRSRTATILDSHYKSSKKEISKVDETQGDDPLMELAYILSENDGISLLGPGENLTPLYKDNSNVHMLDFTLGIPSSVKQSLNLPTVLGPSSMENFLSGNFAADRALTTSLLYSEIGLLSGLTADASKHGLIDRHNCGHFASCIVSSQKEPPASLLAREQCIILHNSPNFFSHCKSGGQGFICESSKKSENHISGDDYLPRKGHETTIFSPSGFEPSILSGIIDLPSEKSFQEESNALNEQKLASQDIEDHFDQLNEKINIVNRIWARWKPNIYRPAVLVSRASSTRSLWKIHFIHWKGTKKTALASIEHMVPCNQSTLHLISSATVLGGGKQKHTRRKVTIKQWAEPNLIFVSDIKDGIVLPVRLHNLALDYRIFRLLRSQWKNFDNIRCLSVMPEKLNEKPFSNLQFWISLGQNKHISLCRKSTIANQIKTLGGIVQAKPTDCEYAILIADGFCRTAKTFLALSLGFPIVEYSWVAECFRRKEFLDLKPYLVSIPNLVDTLPRTTLFGGWVIYLFGGKEFRADWSQVCVACGAQVVDQMKLVRSEKAKGCILLEKNRPDSDRIIKEARRFKASILALQDLLQFIVTGRVCETLAD